MKLLPLALLLVVAPASAQKPKTKTKPAQKPTIGIKGASQVAGGQIRFGEIFALKSGFTFQILSARYSLDPLDDYNKEYPGPNDAFVLLTVAIKNNQRSSDNFFNTESHVFQAVDANNENHEGALYRLRSKPGEAFSPSLKPGQGIGQGGTDPLTVAIKVPLKAQIGKLILKQGREGTSEEVLRFLLSDPKNAVTPLPAWATGSELVPSGTLCPTANYYFRLDSFATASKLGQNDADEGKKWVLALVTVKNGLSSKQGLYDFTGGDDIATMLLVDGDGEKYPASQLLKAKRDEPADGELDGGEERAFRIAFQVPKDATFKTMLLGSPRGHRYRFDASAAGK